MERLLRRHVCADFDLDDLDFVCLGVLLCRASIMPLASPTFGQLLRARLRGKFQPRAFMRHVEICHCPSCGNRVSVPTYTVSEPARVHSVPMFQVARVAVARRMRRLSGVYPSTDACSVGVGLCCLGQPRSLPFLGLPLPPLLLSRRRFGYSLRGVAGTLPQCCVLRARHCTRHFKSRLPTSADTCAPVCLRAVCRRGPLCWRIAASLTAIGVSQRAPPHRAMSAVPNFTRNRRLRPYFAQAELCVLEKYKELIHKMRHET